jgi:voltage-gated potassium channel
VVDRQARRIANARSVTFGMAGSFLVLALVGAIVMRIADSHDFSSVGLAIWWALQTITTVGYGDATPTTTTGRVIGGVEMAFGVALISLLTAAVTSTVIQRDKAREQEEDRAHAEQSTRAILEAVAQARAEIAELGRRLDVVEPEPEGD